MPKKDWVKVLEGFKEWELRYNCDRYNNKLKNGYCVVWKSSRMYIGCGIVTGKAHE